MSRLHLLLLLVITGALIALALLLGGGSDSSEQSASGERLFPELEKQLNEIEKVVVRRSGQEPVTLERRDDRWGVAEKGGYPAAVGELRKSLIGLAELNGLEPKTRNPALYARLGLDPTAEEADTVEIQAFAGGEQRLHAYIGDAGTGGGSYIRMASDPQSWLADAPIAIPRTSKEWLERDLIDLPNDTMQRVELIPVEGEPLTLVRDSGEWQLEGMTLEEGESLDQAEARRLAGALRNLRLDDVMSDAEADAAAIAEEANGEGAPAEAEEEKEEAEQPAASTPRWRTVRFTTLEGQQISAQLRKVDGAHQLRLSARYDAELAQRPAQSEGQREEQNGEQSESSKSDEANETATSEGAERTPATRSAAAVEQEASERQAHWQGWTYILPNFKAESFLLTRADLIERNEAEAPLIPPILDGAGSEMEMGLPPALFGGE